MADGDLAKDVMHAEIPRIIGPAANPRSGWKIRDAFSLPIGRDFEIHVLPVFNTPQRSARTQEIIGVFLSPDWQVSFITVGGAGSASIP